MKKLLLGLGAATSVIAPIAAVVACSGEDKADFGGKVIMGDNLVTLAATIKTQTGIDFDDAAGKAIVTKLSGVVGTTTLTMVGDLKTALDAKNGLIVSVGTKVALKVALTVDANDAKKFTAKVTIDGHPLKMSGTALTSPQAVTVATLLINEVAKEPATTETPTGTKPTASISDMFATITSTNLGTLMTGTFAKADVTQADQTKFIEEIMKVIKPKTPPVSALTSMTISYNNIDTIVNTALEASVMVTLNVALKAFVASHKTADDVTKMKAALQTALRTILPKTT